MNTVPAGTYDEPRDVPQDEPLARVLDLGRTAARRGATVGMVVALVLHGGAAARAMSSPVAVRAWAMHLRAAVHEYLWTTYDIETVKPPTPPEPPKAPAKEEAPPPPPAPRAPPPPKAPAAAPPPPPAPAQAGKILAQDPDGPVDFTGDGFVTGTADSYAGGVTSAQGTSKQAVRDLGARPAGVAGARGTAPVASATAATGPDLSRPGGPKGGANAEWDCPFPPESDVDQIDNEVVGVLVTVRADGTASSVKVLNDPGHGFGRAARLCALRNEYDPPLDRSGKPIAGTLPPIRIRFTR